MPKIVYPRSDVYRIALLDRCFSYVKTTSKTEDQLLSPNILPKIKELKTEYLVIQDKMSTSYAELGLETREKSEVMADLNITVRDFFEVLRRRKVRLKHTDEIFTMYGLHFDGCNPKLTQQSELLSASNTIVIGDANAVIKCYSPMQNPSAEEVAILMMKARKELGDIASADRQYNQHQKSLQHLRKPIDELIREIAA